MNSFQTLVSLQMIQQIHYTFETTITLSVSYFTISFKQNLLSSSSFLTLMPLITCYHLTSVTMLHPEHVRTYFTISHKSTVCTTMHNCSCFSQRNNLFTSSFTKIRKRIQQLDLSVQIFILKYRSDMVFSN